jgi:hypothetical protein
MPIAKSEPYLAHRIEYTRNITGELVELHKAAWKDRGLRLVSAILFGPLASGQYDEDINLLEIVKGYPSGSRSTSVPTFEFPSTRQFPMYGRLRLQVMNPDEFRSAVQERYPIIEELRHQRKLLFDANGFARKLLK